MKRSVAPLPASGAPPQQGRGLERAHDGGADGHDAAAARARRLQGARRVGGNDETLPLHAVLVHQLGGHRLEGADADVQRHRGALDSRRLEPPEQRGVEVQPGGGRGDGAGLAREHGLIALAIGGLVGAFDVRRQRHVAEPLEMRLDRLGEAERAPAVLARRHHFGFEAVGEAHPIARPGAFARLRERVPFPRPELLDQQQLHLAAAPAPAEEPRRHHLGVVDHQQVPRSQDPGQVSHSPVPLRAFRIEAEEPARAARRRALRDAVVGQVVVEVAGEHGSGPGAHEVRIVAVA